MIDLRQLLETAAVRQVLIVDDAYDDTPSAADLSLDADSWRQFFDDKNPEDETVIRGFYGRYDGTRADVLLTQDEFVAALWRNRTTLRPALIDPLFNRYQADRATDLAHLGLLKARLEGLGLNCAEVGRNFKERVGAVDLVVIDLFLGSSQDPAAMEQSVTELQHAIAQRKARPPLVVLMSRSPRLADKRAEFRDRTGLFESAFRIIQKSELNEEGRVNRLLARLAGHYVESLKLAKFLDAWQAGVTQASVRTGNLIRWLDIGDHAQIQQLLLNEEGAPLGSYLIDVFDQVLQHEVERESAIIDAGIELNKFKGENYPPPYVAGSPDLQHLVFRSIFQNAERLRLANSVGSRIGFGDILRRKPLPAVAADAEPIAPLPAPFGELGPNGVFVVLSPACDLQRKGAKEVLTLTGELMALSPGGWTYGDTPVKTAIIELSEGERYWIKWQMKQYATISHGELETLLDAAHGVSIVARLRDSYALELQQKLLSSLGRVGLMSPMPATFALGVDVYLPGVDRKLFRFEGPGLAAISGVCYVGRTGPKDMRLVLCEDDCEAICRNLLTFDIQRIHSDARALVQQALSSGELQYVLEKGVVLPTPDSTEAKEIVVEVANPAGGAATKKVLGLIVRGEKILGRDLSVGEVRKTAICLVVK